MIDINLIRQNPEVVKENIKRKFQDQKLELVDKVLALDVKVRELKQEGDNLRASRNTLSGNIGKLIREGKMDEANDTLLVSTAEIPVTLQFRVQRTRNHIHAASM